jgi:virulence-associated protein VapD
LERKYYKAINFDLDTNRLKEYYPRYQQAYKDLLKFFKGKDFSHRQGSGYVSNNKMSSADIVDLIGDMQKEFDWSGTCIKKIDVTNVGAQYDLTELLISDDSDDTFSI